MASVGKRKAKKNVKITGWKSMGKALVIYRKQRAAGEVGKIQVLEDIDKYFGVKGQLLKRETRYNKQKERLNKGIKAAQKKLGKQPGKKTFERIEKQRSETTRKAAETWAERNRPKTQKGEVDKRFTRVAKEKAKQFTEAVDVFASETYNKLKDDSYGIGSDFVLALTESGLTAEQIEEFLKQFKQTWEDIPDEAKDLAEDDRLWSSLSLIADTLKEADGIVNYSDVLQAYITTSPDMNDFIGALENYIEYSDTSKSFSEVWNKLKDTQQPDNMDNLRELYESED